MKKYCKNCKFNSRKYPGQGGFYCKYDINIYTKLPHMGNESISSLNPDGKCNYYKKKYWKIWL